MPKFSVAICCMNAADTIQQACESASWADELIIVDSGSTDGTQDIARKYADKFVEQKWLGFTKQKKLSAELCSNDWVFILDSDEELSPKLIQQIQQLTDDQLDNLDVIYMPRRNYVMGKYIRAWSPDWQSRLIHRNRVTWPEEALHDARVPSDPSRVLKLSAPLEHKKAAPVDFSDYFSGSRMDARLIQVAQQMYDKGKRASILDLAFRPYFAFFKFYFLKLGFLDGSFGFLIAQKASVSVQLKYAALWTIQQQHKSKS
ncbi:glycosyltransferase family 2 protein [Planctomycetota bacterium]|nr:glycosyltransferase family 2 protein [Planctomycetota bacterium]